MSRLYDLWHLSLSGNPLPPDAIYQQGKYPIYPYEAKRAGVVNERMHYSALKTPMELTNNNNNIQSGGIRDVQVHKHQFGKETRVETELQSCGPATDLNINIIMDSDSNLSNAKVGNSLEYESQDQQMDAEEIAGEDTEEFGGGGEDLRGSGEDGQDGGGGKNDGAGGKGVGEGLDDSEDVGVSSGEGKSKGPDSAEKMEGDDEDDADKEGGIGKAAGGSGGSPGGGSGSGGGSGGGVREKRTSGGGSEEGGDEFAEEEGEGKGDIDDAMKHFQRYLAGEKVDTLRGPSKEDDTKETVKRLPTGHLEKEGVVIGCMSVFADVHVKEFIVMLSDEMIQAFLIDPERFRSVANRTKCEIEVTRRILNRRMGNYRWLKYLVVIIRGPSFSSIDQCDKMMTMLFPPYKWRKPYGMPAAVSMFLKESTPDNTDLYFNYQRTGPCQKMFGEIPLRAPFRKTKARPVEQTPWKMVQKRQQWGVLEPRNDRMERALSHVYPERGGSKVSAMDHNIKWAEAANQAVEMSKLKDLARSQMLINRKTESEPLYARVVGE